MRGLFITGTDTAAGKTFVAAAVALHLRSQGHTVQVSKPVATGATLVEGRQVSEDTLQLAAAVGAAGSDWKAITPWTFAEPVAPAVAARRLGQDLELAQLAEAVHKQHRPGAFLIVEGVGGLLCPLNAAATVADLAFQVGLPLVVVVRNCLGALNHTLLTLEAAQTYGLNVAAVVVNNPAPVGNLAEATNVEELKRRISQPLVISVPYHPSPSNEVWPGLAAVDWWRLGERGK